MCVCVCVRVLGVTVVGQKLFLSPRLVEFALGVFLAFVVTMVGTLFFALKKIVMDYVLKSEKLSAQKEIHIISGSSNFTQTSSFVVRLFSAVDRT